MGPNDQWTDTRKVTKLMAAWQVPSLMHLNSIVQSNREYKHDFEATVTYLSGQLAHQQMKTAGGPGRNIGAVNQTNNGNNSGNNNGNNNGNNGDNNEGGTSQSTRKINKIVKAAVKAALNGKTKSPKKGQQNRKLKTQSECENKFQRNI